MGEASFHPIISSIQKIALYETKEKLCLVGSNDRENRFKILEIDRTCSDKLQIFEDSHERDAKGIRKYLQSLNFTKTICAYGIIGFVRFLEGYYLILVTKRTRCAVIGRHVIYTIKDTAMIKINDGGRDGGRQPHAYEQRYCKMFSNIDMSSNFYFSYSYDLTRTLQYNEAPPSFLGLDKEEDADEEGKLNWDEITGGGIGERREFAFRGNSRTRFVWNQFLLKLTEGIVLKDWMLEIIHGFVSQSNISIFGRPVFVCLIARRSTKFAGTRFLKRGANFSGDVANEVETEQIVTDGNRMCSFTQMRGSIPSHWSQDISKMVPKPPISLDLCDPYSETAGKHFQRVMFHHGAPVIILNLVKKREKRKHESILSEDMVKNVRYLNQFLPAQYRIGYVHFDMARKSRGGGNVMEKLATIAERVIQQTIMYISDGNQKCFQTGIVRVNCVDCLDRTNTAQFAIGKCALSHQLYKLGFIKQAKLEFDSDCVTMLERLYEDHGDTLALQYGGSQLVHRIKTYRKTAAWTSQGNDIMQTLSRYYSNTFSDTEKQHSINLFLGYYIPHENLTKNSAAIWELPTDYYMHNAESIIRVDKNPITQWVSPMILSKLPYSTSCANKTVREIIEIKSKDSEMIDSYSNYYHPYKLTTFEENIAYQISYLARNYLPTFRTNFSPFEPGRRRDVPHNNKNPSLTGQSSTSSTASSPSSSDGDSPSSESECGGEIETSEQDSVAVETTQATPSFSFSTVLSSMQEIYGVKITEPDTKSMDIYRRYYEIHKASTQLKHPLTSSTISDANDSVEFYPTQESKDSSRNVTITPVSEESLDIYKKYVNSVDRIVHGRQDAKTTDIIQKYVKFQMKKKCN